MTGDEDHFGYVESRLLVAGDSERLAPIVSECFAPVPVATARDYLSALAELPRAPTQGVVLGIDRECRRMESAVGTIKQAAGSARVVLCGEPHDEPLCRRLLSAGADDYVIYPPSAEDLQAALHVPSRRTRERWVSDSPLVRGPSTDDLQRLAQLLPVAVAGGRELLREMAAVVAAALRAESAMVVVDGSNGAVGAQHAELLSRAVLIQEIVRRGRVAGQIRIGPSETGAYSAADALRLRDYAALFGSLVDLAARSRHWRRLAYEDELTGLPNRRHLQHFLEDLLARAEREEFPVTLLLFDIDDFKTFNDRFGHDVGDEIIRETGRLFRACCRKHDLVSRYGGDEFVVVFWDPAGPRSAGSQHPREVVNVLNRFRHRLATHEFARLGPRSMGGLTCSGGLARFPTDARTAADLLHHADQAALAAKRAGKNRMWLIGTGDVCQT
ncbi:MAG: GGDEF domain-containing protein [Phycisphaerae bacterium]